MLKSTLDRHRERSKPSLPHAIGIATHVCISNPLEHFGRKHPYRGHGLLLAGFPRLTLSLTSQLPSRVRRVDDNYSIQC